MKNPVSKVAPSASHGRVVPAKDQPRERSSGHTLYLYEAPNYLPEEPVFLKAHLHDDPANPGPLARLALLSGRPHQLLLVDSPALIPGSTTAASLMVRMADDHGNPLDGCPLFIWDVLHQEVAMEKQTDGCRLLTIPPPPRPSRKTATYSALLQASGSPVPLEIPLKHDSAVKIILSISPAVLLADGKDHSTIRAWAEDHHGNIVSMRPHIQVSAGRLTSLHEADDDSFEARYQPPHDTPIEEIIVTATIPTPHGAPIREERRIELLPPVAGGRLGVLAGPILDHRDMLSASLPPIYLISGSLRIPNPWIDLSIEAEFGMSSFPGPIVAMILGRYDLPINRRWGVHGAVGMGYGWRLGNLYATQHFKGGTSWLIGPGEILLEVGLLRGSVTGFLPVVGYLIRL